MKAGLLTFAVVVVAVYFYQARSDRLAREEAAMQQRIALANAERIAFEDFVERTGANEDWHSKLLAKRKSRVDRLFSIDLFEAWTEIDGPVLLIGSVLDVSEISPGEYILLIESAPGFSSRFLTEFDWRVSLNAQEKQLGSILAPDSRARARRGVGARMLIAATIDRVQPTDVPSEIGGTSVIPSGTGTLVDMQALGENWFPYLEAK